MHLGQKIRMIFKKLRGFMAEQAKNSERQMVTFGIFGAIAYPLFGFLNLRVLQPKEYENIYLRLVIGVLCLGLIFRNYWPKKFRSFLDLYWYFTLLLGLPFFFTFMMLENNASNAWLLNLLTVLFFVIFVIDWLSAICLFSIGGFLGWFVYYFSSDHPFVYALEPISYKDFIGAYIVTIVLGILFSRNKQLSEKERLQTLKSLSGSIAHELRTPLSAIQLGIQSAQEYYPILLAGYNSAKDSGLQVPPISTKQMQLLSETIGDMEIETENANMFINIMLMNLKNDPSYKNSFETYSIQLCLKEAIQRYPFRQEEKELITLDESRDFLFNGDKLLIIYVIFNLLKNSFFFIEAARKGNITIWCEEGKKMNFLNFKDTAQGISPKELSKLFEKFYSTTRHGTGLGLAYCKMVMTALGGDIHCKSEFGNFTQFILEFPHVQD